jgi:hypothetical protein
MCSYKNDPTTKSKTLNITIWIYSCTMMDFFGGFTVHRQRQRWEHCCLRLVSGMTRVQSYELCWINSSISRYKTDCAVPSVLLQYGLLVSAFLKMVLIQLLWIAQIVMYPYIKDEIYEMIMTHLLWVAIYKCAVLPAIQRNMLLISSGSPSGHAWSTQH